jgi:hypothetical protein
MEEEGISGREGVKEGRKGEYGWCIYYTRINIEFLDLLNSPWGED